MGGGDCRTPLDTNEDSQTSKELTDSCLGKLMGQHKPELHTHRLGAGLGVGSDCWMKWFRDQGKGLKIAGGS